MQEIDSMVGRDVTHQGVCALLNERKVYTPLEEVLQKAKNSPTRPLFVLLDELQDPHNVGAIIRSAAAFGATAILMPEHDQVQVTGTVIKTSAGAVFSVPIAHIGNINTTLKNLKKEGFWVYALTGDGDTNLHTTTFDTDTVIVVGAEGQGIKPKTLEACDFKLSIPIDKRVESLNASNAVAVTLYEWNKQQR
jgi:23S rRNA (guanosine2251-2'-O)-methyltransferase